MKRQKGRREGEREREREGEAAGGMAQIGVWDIQRQ